MDKFEEYKLLIERAGKQSERRQAATQTYLAVNTVIIGALGFMVKDSGLVGWALLLTALPLFIVGIMACAIWLRIMVKMEFFLDWQYDRLREMESALEGCSRMLTRENEAFYQPPGSKKRFSFSLQEAWLPRLLILLYALYSLALLLAVLFGWL